MGTGGSKDGNHHHNNGNKSPAHKGGNVKHDLNKEKPLKNRHGEVIKWVPLTPKEIADRKKKMGSKAKNVSHSDTDSDTDSDSESGSDSDSSSDSSPRHTAAGRKSPMVGVGAGRKTAHTAKSTAAAAKKYPASLRRHSADSLEETYTRHSRRSLRSNSIAASKQHLRGQQQHQGMGSRRNSFNNKLDSRHSGRSSTSDYHSAGSHGGHHKQYHPVHKYPAPRPTLRPKSKFHHDDQVALLHKAVQGLGTKEDLIINLLGEMTSDQRQDVREAYRSRYRKDLEDIFHDELSGEFEEICIALITDDLTFDVQNVNLLLERPSRHVPLIGLMAKTNFNNRKLIRKRYATDYKEDLMKAIKSDTDGHTTEVLTAIFSEKRNPSKGIDHDAAQKDAEDLMDAAKHKDKKEMISLLLDIISHQNSHQVREVCEAFRQLDHDELSKTISTILGAKDSIPFNAFFEACDETAVFFATCFNKCLKGSGTDEICLIRLIGSRCEVDLADIDVAYKELYRVPLSKAIKDDTHGLFEKMLLKLLNPKETVH